MRIAIIGGIGSGKSEVLAVAREMGIKGVSADEINKELMNDPAYAAKLAAAFPEAVKDGKIVKETLAATVFSNEEKRLKLNSIAHPEILKRIEAETADPIVVELPLAQECGAGGKFDEVILVTARFAHRLKRLRERGVPTERALRIMMIQPPQTALKKYATRSIENTGNLEELRSAAKEIFRILCE